MPDLSPSDPAASGLPFAERARLLLQLWTVRLREYVAFDSTLVGWLCAWGAACAAACFALAGRNRRALDLLSAAHRSNRSQTVRAIAERVLQQPVSRETRLGARVHDAYGEFLRSVDAGEPQRKAESLIGTRLIVVKSPAKNERGVIVIDYTHSFAILARHCDLTTLSQEYYIVLEPSWVGYCTPEILVYSSLTEPVFVEGNEAPDIAFLKRISPNFVHVQAQGNCWVDHRLFRPVAGVAKDVDVSMVSAWMRFKRHSAVFAALQRLRRRGIRLRTLLIGYPMDGTLTRDDIHRQARYFDVADQIEIRENVRPEQVSAELSRSKVHVLWSRREGFNRAIIEAMLTGVPAILRAGHNYGQHYPYINSRTGRFATEANLPEALVSMTERYREFSPREWVMEHMTPQIATAVMNDAIRSAALSRGEAWTSDIVVRTVQLNHAPYWDPADAQRFTTDYTYIRSLLR